MRIRISSIIATMLYFILFIDVSYLPWYHSIRNVFIVIVALYLLVTTKDILKIIKKPLFVVTTMFMLLIIVTSYANYSLAAGHFHDMIVFIAGILELIVFFTATRSKNNIENYCSIIFWIHLVMLAVTDFLVLVNPELGIKYDGYYLIGNKFTVTYAHLLLIGLYYLRKNSDINKRLRDMVFCFFVLLMMIIVGQVTLSASSIICAAIMIVVLYLLRNENSKLYSSLWVNIVLGASALFAFFNAILLQLPFVAYIITKVLKKNMYLTARVMIYEKVAELFLQKPLTGYGFGTSYDVWMDAYGFQNTQNGLLDWVEQAGIIAPALIMVIICFALKEYKGSKCRNIQTKGMLAVLYTLSFMASIEICLNTQFFCVVVLIYAMNEVLKDRIDNKQ